MTSKHLLLISLFCIASFATEARQVPIEYVDVHLAKNIAVAGETIWFKVVVTSDNGTGHSRLGYAELVGRDGRVVNKAIIPLEEGIGSAYLDLPLSLETDHYLLRCYTRTSPMMHIEGVNNQFITVFNPTKPPLPVSVADTVVRYTFRNTNTDAVPPITGVVNSSVNIKSVNVVQSDVLSVSIALANPYLPQHFSGVGIGSIYKALPSDLPLVPEPYGHIVHAKNIESVQDTTETFFLSAHGRQSFLTSAKPNANGNLFFELGAFKDYNYLIIQSAKSDRQLNISLQQPFLPFEFRDDFKFPDLKISEDDKSFIQHVALSGKVAGYYYSDTTMQHAPMVTGIAADISYMLDDYTRFENFATTLKEYVPSVYVRGQGRKTMFKVVNAPKNLAFEDNPLILIDGMPVFDTDALGEFDAIKIKKLEVVNREYSFNKDKYSGLINLTSYNNDFGGFALPPNALYLNYPELQQRRELKSNHVNNKHGEKYAPDFRSLLYWDASAASQPTNVYTSTIPGKYIITIGSAQYGKRLTLHQSILHVQSADTP